jgi:plasmid stabilization system protein ParE
VRIRANRAAARELTEARRWYRSRSRQAELDLYAAYKRARAQLERAPRSGAEYIGGTRRIVLTDFPYVLVYRIDASEVIIVAIAHTSRVPGYWLGR